MFQLSSFIIRYKMQNSRIFPILLLLLLCLCLHCSMFVNGKVIGGGSIKHGNKYEAVGDNVPDEVVYEVIYLKSKPERLANIKAMSLKVRINLNYNEGVNISAFTSEKLVGLNKKEDSWNTWRYRHSSNSSKHSVFLGEVGCFMSHMNVLKKVADKKLMKGWTVVLEDDFAAHYHFKSVLHSVLHAVNTSTDLIYLGNCWQKTCSKGVFKDVVSPTSVRHSVCYADEPMGTVGYAVRNDRAAKVLGLLRLEMNDAVDVVLKRLIARQQLNAMVVIPPIIIGAAPGATSSIG